MYIQVLKNLPSCVTRYNDKHIVTVGKMFLFFLTLCCCLVIIILLFFPPCREQKNVDSLVSQTQAFFSSPPFRGFVRRPALPVGVCLSPSCRSRPANANHVAIEQAVWQDCGMETQQTR